MDWSHFADASQWEFWLGIGLVLAILEVIDGSFFLLSLGLGFMLTAIPAANGVESVSLLLASCAVNQIAIFLLVRPVIMRSMSKDAPATNVDALIGRSGLVTERIGGTVDSGYVRVDSEEWRALCTSDVELAEGSPVRVAEISGATLYVEPAEDLDPV